MHRRSALLAATAIWLALGCQDVRDFAGTWTGPRIGEADVLGQGFAVDATATLEVSRLDLEGLAATLSTSDGVFDGAEVAPHAGARADVLGELSTAGSPVRVFLCLVDTADGGGVATVFVSLYGDERVEIRVLRGGPQPLYGIFQLSS